MGRSLAFASAGFLSFAAAAQGLRSSITAASDLNEEINKSNVVFRGSEKQVQNWSEHLRAAFGLTRGEALHTAATFGNMLVPMGFIRKQAAQMSERLVGLAGDMASFNNAGPVEILQALQAGLANQPRPLRRFGVFLSQARIAAEAFSSGIVKTNVNLGKLRDAQTKVDIAQAQSASARKKFGANSLEAAKAGITLHNAERLLGKELAGNIPKLTNAQRTLAIYRIILKDTADAQGDAARTSGAFAGQLRKEHAEVGNLEEKIGRLLMPTVLQYLTAGNQWLSQNKNQQKVLRTVKDGVHLFTAAVSGAKEVLGPLAHAAEGVSKAVGGWKNAFEIITGLYLVNKLRKLADAIKAARLTMLGLGGDLSTLTATPWVITVLVAYKDIKHPKSIEDRAKGLLGVIRGSGKIEQGLETLPTVGPLVAALHGGLPKERRSEPPMPGPSPEDVHPGIHSAARQAWEKDAAAAKAAAATVKAHRLAVTAAQAAFELPFKLQLDQAKGEAFRNNAAILKAAKEARAFILKALPHLKGAHLLEAYGLLGQANDTIASAAEEAASKAKADAERARAKMRAAREKMQQAIAKMQQALDNVRSQIGELFQGPVLAPTEAQTKAKLGVPGTKASDLTKDLRAQTAQFVRFQRDLAILQKRGASKELIKELRAKGVQALPEVESLAKASRKDLQAFFKAFRGRELEIRKVAKVEIRAAQVTIRAARLVIQGIRGPEPRNRHGRPIHKMAKGGLGTVSRPTVFLAGEAGAEDFAFAPHRKGGLSLRAQVPTARASTGNGAVVPLPRGAGGVERIEVPVYLDGAEIARAVTTRQQRATKTSAPQVRGRHYGQILGTN